MCGIIGHTGKLDSVTVVIDGLRRLEYRGYDSAGIAYLEGDEIKVTRCKGKIKALDTLLCDTKPISHTAIGHTRWATHGKPSEENAHPHRSGSVVITHNGIIENYIQLRKQLKAEGFVFTSETDTEVICHLIHKYAKGVPIEEAVRKATRELRGAYALAVMDASEPGKIVGIRKDSPLVVGLADGNYFLASDVPAFLSHSRNIIFLDDEEMAVLTPEGVVISNLAGDTLDKQPVTIDWNPTMAEKGGYKHFMLKEIFEQPRAIADTISGRVNPETGEINIDEFNLDPEFLGKVKRICIVACGTSWHAAVIGKYMIEELTRVPVEIDIASEYRYRNPIMDPLDLFISITQSGETADTLAAQRLVQKAGTRVLNICNVIGSTSTREAESVFYTRSGPEIGVASTKAFTTQIVALFLFALLLGKTRGTIDEKHSRELIDELLRIPDKVEHALLSDAHIRQVSYELHKSEAFLFLGRGINFPIALEGALKLKEISYIHAEGYAAGEMKHGPIALIDEGYPVVVCAPKGRLFEKILSNIEEVRSRGGTIIVISNSDNEEESMRAAEFIHVPEAHPLLQPILFAIPMQLLAYHIGIQRGCDVDQPRNLAKSVTVE